MSLFTKEEHIKIIRNGKKIKLKRTGDKSLRPVTNLEKQVREYKQREKQKKRERRRKELKPLFNDLRTLKNMGQKWSDNILQESQKKKFRR